MAFSGPEREFLRLAALPQTATAELADLVGEGFDWQQLLDTAMVHQLEGVMRWRLLAEDMAGLVPLPIRDRVVVESNRLEDKHGVEWRADAEILFSALTSQGIPYVTSGGPVPYLVYPDFGVWPRQFADIDFWSPSSAYSAVRGLLRDLGEVMLDEAMTLDVRLPHGTKAVCACPPPALEQVHHVSHLLRLGDPPVEADVFGTPMRVADPLTEAFLAADAAYLSFTYEEGPFSLFDVAQIGSAVSGLEADAVGRRVSLLAEAARRGELMPAVSHPTRLYAIRLLFGLVDEIYGMDRSITEALDDSAFDPTWLCVEDPPQTYRRYEWGAFPSAETLIIDWRFKTSAAERCELGLWRGPLGPAWTEEDDEKLYETEYGYVRPATQ